MVKLRGKNYYYLSSKCFLMKCVCNIDCSQTNFNPLCASDGKSYDNACQIKEASCQKQEKIEVMSLGRCQDNTTTTTKSEDGHYARTDYAVHKHKMYHLRMFGLIWSTETHLHEQIWDFQFLLIFLSSAQYLYLDKKKGSSHHFTLSYIVRLTFPSPVFTENANKLEESARGIYIPCPEHYNGFCMHGKCEHSTNMLEPSCRCDAGYTGQHCEKKDYSVLYVVPGPVRFQYVLIAAVIGTIQIAIICVVVLCITSSSGNFESTELSSRVLSWSKISDNYGCGKGEE
ncbi:hypothetical protein BTVI_124279 [Pitangus sulphuratus]|nr:hypothetical protein BTVI_124279 [Pitangus sulphuratus]